MRPFRQVRQVLAQLNVRGRRSDRVELAAILRRDVRLHVPQIDVRRATGQKYYDRRPGYLAIQGACDRSGLHATLQPEPAAAHAAGCQKRATIKKTVMWIVYSLHKLIGIPIRAEGLKRPVRPLFWLGSR